MEKQYSIADADWNCVRSGKKRGDDHPVIPSAFIFAAASVAAAASPRAVAVGELPATLLAPPEEAPSAGEQHHQPLAIGTLLFRRVRHTITSR